MSAKHYPNSGALFKNQRKTKPDHPDYTGQAEVDGEDYWLSAWIKESKDGAKFMSISFKPKEETGKPARMSREPQDDQDIPW